jgi:hypothetical protein
VVVDTKRSDDVVVLLVREDGVGVDMFETDRNGSAAEDVEQLRGLWVDEADNDFELADGRSSRAGGSIPSSVYNQSICIMVVDS